MKVGILTILGISVLIAGILCLVIFVAERVGISPVWSLLSLPGLTEGENVILFIIFLIGGIFIALLIIGAIFGSSSKKTSSRPHHK
jgi:hypothetical protein